MPWTPNDAERHTHKAATPELQELWAKVANDRAPSGRRALTARALPTITASRSPQWSKPADDTKTSPSVRATAASRWR